MAFYATLQTVNHPDPVVVLASIKTAIGDATAVLVDVRDGWKGKKATVWTSQQIAAAQNVLDTTPPVTPEVVAQRAIDSYPIELRALVLALVDQLNVVRAALPTPKAAITPAQALQAIRDKAATL
jgi:hypothetical protein